MIEGYLLFSFIQSNYFKQWNDMVQHPFGHEGRRKFHMLSWLFSTDCFGDERVEKLKAIYRQFVVFGLTVFVANLAMFLILS